MDGLSLESLFFAKNGIQKDVFGILKKRLVVAVLQVLGDKCDFLQPQASTVAVVDIFCDVFRFRSSVVLSTLYPKGLTKNQEFFLGCLPVCVLYKAIAPQITSKKLCMVIGSSISLLEVCILESSCYFLHLKILSKCKNYKAKKKSNSILVR